MTHYGLFVEIFLAIMFWHERREEKGLEECGEHRVQNIGKEVRANVTRPAFPIIDPASKCDQIKKHCTEQRGAQCPYQAHADARDNF